MKNMLRTVLGEVALRIGHRVLLLLGGTWRVRHVGRDRVDRARFGSGPVIYAFTHGVILPLVYTHRGRGAVVLISESRDGILMARVAELLGLRTVRGSSTRGGARAVVELVRCAREGRDLAITPDGPRGPRGTVAPGITHVASRGEIPIAPIGVAADRAWRLRSWDRFLIPHPGAHVAVVYGGPICVPAGASEEVLAVASARLKGSLEELEETAERIVREHFRGVATTRIPA